MSQITMSSTPAPENRPHKPADDTEEVYFTGSPLLRAEMGKLILFGFIALLLLALPILNLAKWKYDWYWWIYLLLIGAAAVVAAMPVLLQKTLRYRITNYRIDVSSGVLSRNTDTIELWHVEDLRLHQSLLNRMVDCGTITITSHDMALPMLPLRGLPKPRELFQQLEQRVIAVKRQRGVMKVDSGS